MTYLKTPRTRVLKFRDIFSFKAFEYTTGSSKDLFDVLEEKVEEDIGFEQWFANTKASLENSKGRFWLGKSTPFPYNSLFVPKPILSDATKTRIFELFKQNQSLNDHRILAHKFKVSIDRIKAIIRQKELELELAKQGKIVDKEFISSLESNLECVEISDEHLEYKTYDKKLPFRPLFACVPEGRVFSFQDAKNALSAAGINIKSPSDEIKGKYINKSDTEDSKVLNKSSFETSRSKFIFVNTAKTENLIDNIVLVRDCDGTLRTADRKEAEYALNKTWNRNSPETK